MRVGPCLVPIGAAVFGKKSRLDFFGHGDRYLFKFDVCLYGLLELCVDLSIFLFIFVFVVSRERQ